MHGANESAVNAQLASLLAGENYGEVAARSAEHLGDYAPLRFDPPPPWLASAIEQARELGRAGNLQAAANVRDNILGSHDQAVELGTYREHVTWVERTNARRLWGLAWLWRTLYRQPSSVERDRLIERVERFVVDVWELQDLRLERGDAERMTRNEWVLPRAWRGDV
jgi:hypothetical protein